MLIGAGEIISRSVKLYRENFALFAKYALLIFVPALIIMLGFFAGGLGGLLAGSTFNSGEAGIGVGIVIAIVVGLISFYFTVWFTCSLMRSILDRYTGTATLSIKEMLKKTRHLTLPAIAASLLTGLVVVGGFILFIIPGIIFSVWFYFAIYKVMLDEKKPMDALRESKTLVAGRWFGVLWRLMAPAFVFGILAWLAEMVVTMPFVIFSMRSVAAAIVNGVISTLINILIIPLTSASLVILYTELKKTSLLQSTPAPTPPSQPTA